MKKAFALLLSVLTLFAVAPPVFADKVEAEPEYWLGADSHLMNMNYTNMDTRTELAVGDALYIFYNGDEPADVYLNGEAVYRFDGEEDGYYRFTIAETGGITVALVRGEETLLERSFTVITSKEMYPKTVKEMIAEMTSIRLNPFPSAEELKEAASSGFPVGNPFLPFAYAAMIITNLILLLFSFTRIIR